MASFKKAVEEVLLFEGGYVNDPDDPGGETKFGISARFNPGVDIKNLTIDQASEIYYSKYWMPSGAYRIKDDDVATKYFSMAVNIGTPNAVFCLQRALRAVRADVTEDGILGSETAGAANSSNPRQVLSAFRSECASYYRLRIQEHPEKVKWAKGWLRRAYA